MRKGKPIHCHDTARELPADGHPGLVVTVESPALLRVSGVLDIATKDLLEAVLSELCSPELHLDVGGLQFADAAGLAVIAAADADRRATGRGRLVLHRSSALLRRTLVAARLDRLLPWGPQAEDEGDWRRFAACREEPVALFFEHDDPLPARRLCWSCPVSGSCLSYALRTRQAFGVWGGLTARERSVLTGTQTVDAMRGVR